MTIIFVFIIALVIIFLLFLVARNANFMSPKNSIDADAIILNIHLTGISIKNEVQAIIQLQVQPERGKSFVSELKVMLAATEYSYVQPGKKIRVRYNPQNHKELSIVAATWKRESEIVNSQW